LGALTLMGCGRIGFAPIIDGSGDSGTRSTPGFVQYNDGMGATTAPPISYVAPVAAHDLLVVTVGFDTATRVLTSVTDTTGDTFTILPELAADANQGRYVAYAIANTSAVETITPVVSGSGIVIVRVHEYAGVDPTHPLDAFTTNTGSACGTDAMAVQITTAYDHELVFVYAASAGVTSAGAGFTGHSTISDGVTEDRVEPSAGSQLATATCTTGPWTIEALALIGE
jgi:hypothetical protein